MKADVATAFETAGLADGRFVSVKDGQKMCVDHDTRYDDPRGVPGENYGIYADEDDQLVVLDVDYHREGGEDLSAVSLAALGGLPRTLKFQSPHVPADNDRGGHRVLKLAGDETPAELFERVFGKKNPVPSWGEVISKNKYIVGAGSQLDGCTKDWCEDCSESEGGYYKIKHNNQIATVDPETLVEALAADEDLEDSRKTNQSLEDSTPASGAGSKTEQDSESDYPPLQTKTVANLLDALPGDQHFDDWIRTGYCVFDWDSTERGKAVFERWSLSNQKWEEDDSQYQIDYIWSAGESGDDSKGTATVGSLVRDAREHGYDGELSKADFDERVPSYDEEEVERAEDLLQAECGRDDPAGDMVHRNGHYGYLEDEYDESGEIIGQTFNPATNFTLETLEHLKTDDSELLRVRVHPAHPMEDEYEIEIHPTVFNETRTFKEEVVRGRTTRYEPGKRNQQALNDLRETVGSQLVATRIGSEHIGLCGDEYGEWVTPKGTIDESGAAEDPDYRYYAKGGASDSDGGALARKWQLDPDTLDEFDSDDVGRILELLPKTRRQDRGLPILGWFYAAPLRPMIHDWEGEFNLLQVVGSTGTGKTSTLKAYWEAFGMQPDPFSASDTPFTLMKHMASSSGIPVWIDEYKPADIRNDRLDTLHRRLREVTKGTAVSKGRANLGEVLFRIKAPVVVSGEQKFSQSVPAVRRRSIMTTLSEEPTTDGSSYTEAFSKLTGTAYEDEDGSVRYPSGYDLSDHARAYYRFLLSQDADDLEDLWNECREDTGDLLAERDLALDSTEFQGAQTILFGVRVYREFADTVDADLSTLPADTEVADAFEHFASNIGKDGQRRGYDDTFLELFAQAASAEYVEKGEDFRFVESQKWGTEVLAFHMPSIYAGVKRYVRDYNLGDEHNIIGKTDYLSAFSDKSEKDHSHVLKTNHATRLEGGRTKCVVIDPERTKQKLGSDFDLRAVGYTPEEDEEQEAKSNDDEDDSDGDGSRPDHPEPVSIEEIDAVTQDVASVTADVEFGEWDGLNTEEEGPAWTATLDDGTDTAELVVWDEDDIPEFYDSTGVFTADTLDVRGVEVSEYDGTLQLVVGNNTTIYEAPDDGQEQLDTAETEDTDSEAAADGGTLAETEADDLQQTKPKVARAVQKLARDHPKGVPLDAIKDELDLSPGRVEEAVEAACTEGPISRSPEGGYQT